MTNIINPTLPVQWDLPALFQPPATYPAPEVQEEGVNSVYFEGLPFQGKPTRVFAFYGVPEAAQPVPGMVLVHGGGGSAYIDWVRLWNRRGFAAIAMDLNGQLPTGGYENWTRHAWAGPVGICAPGTGGMDEIDWPLEDQWPYHAVGAVLSAHSLLRALPGVDGERIGITGLSWGGYTTCLLAGIDARFRFAIPVYGCGFLGENSIWLPKFAEMDEERAQRWLGLWDPKHYLPHATMPMLWVTGTNDFAYPMDSWQQSYRLPAVPRALCLRVRMEHAHGGPGENPAEIAAFARHFTGYGPPLPEILTQQRHGNAVRATYRTQTRITHAEFNYTFDQGTWPEREWHSRPAQLDGEQIIATIPDGATVYYLNLFDNRDCAVSSEHEALVVDQ